jgi:hypothetical protein
MAGQWSLLVAYLSIDSGKTLNKEYKCEDNRPI